INQELHKKKNSAIAAFNTMRNMKCKVFDDTLILGEPTKKIDLLQKPVLPSRTQGLKMAYATALMNDVLKVLKLDVPKTLQRQDVEKRLQTK
ncbi:MAG: hypothetical protein LBF84_03755, partial [Holosporales bacterium]|nr:hypothetical protein [Holosporales bacterium]